MPLPRSLVPLQGESLPGLLLRLSHRLDQPPSVIAFRSDLTRRIGIPTPANHGLHSVEWMPSTAASTPEQWAPLGGVEAGIVGAHHRTGCAPSGPLSGRGSSLPLLCERRVDVLAAPAISGEVVVEQMRLAAHSETFAHAYRCGVEDIQAGEDPVDSQPTEGQRGEGACRFSGVTLSGVPRVEDPTDLGLLGARTPESEDYLADDTRFVRPAHGQQEHIAVVLPGGPVSPRGDGLGTALAGKRRTVEVTGDFRQRLVRIPIVNVTWCEEPQKQPLGRDRCRNVLRDSGHRPP